MALDGDSKMVLQLNSNLQPAIANEEYVEVKVLVLYWENADVSFKDEAGKVSGLFEGVFHYQVIEYAIPTERSFSSLMGLVSTTLGEYRTKKGLLIIHYGGHSDKDDDGHSGQEHRPVWAAHPMGDRTLPWYKIEDLVLEECDLDVLLILDCSYATQVGRQRDSGHRRFEVLAAAPIGVTTPGPGPRSFTSVFVEETKKAIMDKGFMNVNQMHAYLCKRNLWASPLYLSLKPGGNQIQLEPLAKERAYIVKAQSFIPILALIKEQLNREHMDDLRHWLTHNVPRSAGLEVFDRAEKIHLALEDLSRGQKVFARQIDEDSKDEIFEAWVRIVEMAKQYQRSAGQMINRTSRSLHAREFVKRMDAKVHSVHILLERAILVNPGLGNPEAMDQVIKDETMRSLGMSDKLYMRYFPRLGDESTRPDFRDRSYEGRAVMQETKKYGPYISAEEMMVFRARLADLVRLLNASKSADFRSLKCIGCTHQPLEHSYSLDFEVPPGFDGSKHNSLQYIIRRVKRQDRPSLNERLWMSYCIAKALYQFHLVGWLYEGVSSSNVIFFNRDGENHADYSNPFLHGFELAHPDSDSYIEFAMDDIDFHLYRHPDRQGSVRKVHKQKNALYSLGVVLLEIGMWSTASSIIRESKSSPYSPGQIQYTLRKACRKWLPYYAGESYSAAVEACLTSQFGVDVDGEMGSGLLKDFQEKVIDKLSGGGMVCMKQQSEKVFKSHVNPLLDNTTYIKIQDEGEFPSNQGDQVPHDMLMNPMPLTDALVGKNGHIVRTIDQAIESKVVRTGDQIRIGITFEVAWELQRCIQDELDGDYDIGPVLTISGDGSHFWATSCLEYVEHTWPTLGRVFLQLLQRKASLSHKERTYPRDVGDGHPEEEGYGDQGTPVIDLQLPSLEMEACNTSSTVNCSGTVEEITALAELLSWITATFRLPRSGELCSSTVAFKDTTSEADPQLRFSICAEALQPFNKGGQGACWAPLFPTTILAYGFFAPENPLTYGLQISVDGMLEMTDILYDVNFESEDGLVKGTYFDGIAWRLYPTAYFKETNTVQWHLVKKEPHEENHQGLPPKLHGGPEWLGGVSLDTLRSAIAVLGYCDDAHVYLGTAERKGQYKKFSPCRTREERPPKQLTLGNVSFGIGLKPLNVSMSFAVKKRKGLVDSRKDEAVKNFSLLVDCISKKPVILLDTEKGEEKAWMVSQLSMFLDLYNYWAFKKGLCDIKYAKPGADGGQQAKSILDDEVYTTRVIYKKIGSDDQDLNVADMIMRIYGRFMHRGPSGRDSHQLSDITAPMGRAGNSILGWDWLALVESTPLDESPRLEVPMRDAGMPPWAALTKTVRVLFGHGMGELIKPQKPQDVCGNWCPVPGGLESLYLVTTVPCVKAREAFGRAEKPGLAPGIVWDFSNDCIFQPCVHGKLDVEKCIKQPQSLYIELDNSYQKLHKKPLTSTSKVAEVSQARNPSLQIPSNGAVIFAKSRKSEKMLSKLMAPGDSAGEGSRGTGNSRKDVDDDAAPSQAVQKRPRQSSPQRLGPRVNGAVDSDLIETGSVDLLALRTKKSRACNTKDKKDWSFHDTNLPSWGEEMIESAEIKADLNSNRPGAALVPEAIKLFFKEHCDSLNNEEQGRVLAKLHDHEWADVFLDVGEGDIAKQRRDVLVELLKK